MSKLMKWIANIIGVILTLTGIVWILQGTNILQTGVMAGQGQWAVIGLVVGIVGIGLLLYVNRRAGNTPRGTH
ncbi:MAG: hypothetical protein WCF84_25390 [Anaerolineae bacterium]